MSNVQRPMSASRPREVKTGAVLDSATQKRKPDVGHRTLDVGPSAADIGYWTLDIRLSVSDLRKAFLSPTGERIDVLRGVTFSVRAGEAVAIMGASGAGKSTLLHLLGGLEAADHGSIEAGKFPIDRAKPSAMARFRNQQVGFVFQFHHLLADLTALENLSLPLRIKRVSPREARLRAATMLEQVGLDSRVSDSLVSHLSGGEQQRVAVGRALISRPAIVLADEPTGNLDTATGDEVARLLVSYVRSAGSLLIIATHNRAVAEMCDRTLILSEGRVHQ
jgi:lipoprotein-releasing system ATP-binding protein